MPTELIAVITGIVLMLPLAIMYFEEKGKK